MTITTVRSTPTVLVALDKFKGSIGAAEACDAVSAGITAAGHACVTCPIADGGDGTIDALVSAGYNRVPITVPGPVGVAHQASFAMAAATAVIELAQVCGLELLPDGRLEPWQSGTLGLGTAVMRALDHSARHVVLALGGSASTDGGLGMLLGLGARVLDSTGEPCEPNATGMVRAATLDLSGLDPRLPGVRFSVAADVTSPLIGPRGAAEVFGPQKGATIDDVAALDRGLEAWAVLLDDATGVDASHLPSAGAAGGTGAAAMTVLHADVISGADFVLNAVGLDELLDSADLVVIGEGSWDEQTEAGKAPMVVLRRAVAAGTPVVLVAGRVAAQSDQLTELGIQRSYQLLDLEPDPTLAMREPKPLLQRIGETVGRDWELTRTGSQAAVPQPHPDRDARVNSR